MIIFTGNNLEITNFHIAGNSIDIHGSIICTNSAIQKGNWKAKIQHDPEKLSYLDDYLPENFEVINEGDRTINLSYWKEVDN